MTTTLGRQARWCKPNFIKDRIKSDDYRQYLGVLAVVRRDFERLSSLMEQQNWQLSPTQAGDAVERDGVHKFATLEEERKSEAERINRIVLYIDDLDRCPPRKVVEVLQAVHLLLAFPLFIVVVGVDARWVQRSLSTTYGRLLTGGGGGATPEDYLEKVFQIPFWLEDTPAPARERMLRGLLDASVQAEPPTITGIDGSPVAAPPGRFATVQLGNGSDRTPLPTGHGQLGGELVAAPNPPDPQALKLRKFELEYMVELTPVLGKSPRALKRFVNIYRLIKAGLADDAQVAFLNMGQYRSVQLVLAIATGTPRLAPNLFEAVRRAGRDMPLVEFIRQLDCDKTNGKSTDWPRVRGFLTDVRIAEFGPDVGIWSDWARAR
jgi:hypothetical protein